MKTRGSIFGLKYSGQGKVTDPPGCSSDRLESPSETPGSPARATPPERVILKEIRTYLENLGCYVVRQQQGLGQRRGVPDLLACCRGRFLALEVKRVGGKLSPHQVAELEAADEAGAIADVVYSVDDVERLLIRGYSLRMWRMAR
jgi:hypothetical protein